jgi:hypothetical protein
MKSAKLLTRASNFGLYSGVTVSTYLGISMPAFYFKLTISASEKTKQSYMK